MIIRLPQGRHPRPVRRARRAGGSLHWLLRPASPLHRVLRLPRSGRGQRAGRPRCAFGARQRGHSQKQADPRLATDAPALAPTLHADLSLVASPCGGLVRTVGSDSFNAACSKPGAIWKPPSTTTSIAPTQSRSCSSGPSQQPISSRASNASVDELPTQITGRRAAACLTLSLSAGC